MQKLAINIQHVEACTGSMWLAPQSSIANGTRGIAMVEDLLLHRLAVGRLQNRNNTVLASTPSSPDTSLLLHAHGSDILLTRADHPIQRSENPILLR